MDDEYDYVFEVVFDSWQFTDYEILQQDAIIKYDWITYRDLEAEEEDRLRIRSWKE